jgi:hypothetical protein
VFYELGVRHALHKRGTVLICRKGSGEDKVSALPMPRLFPGKGENVPFNIRNMAVFDYELSKKGKLLTDPQRLADQITTAAKETQVEVCPTNISRTCGSISASDRLGDARERLGSH